MDWSVAHSLNNFLWHHDGLEDPVTFYVRISEAAFLAMLLIVIALARHDRWRSVRRAAVAAGLSAGLGLLVVKIITSFTYRARPFVAHPHAVHLFIAHGADSSFPSDHATASMAIAVAILLRHKLGWGLIALAFSLILLYGRVALGFHYPTDVLAGALIGAIAAFLLWIPRIRAAIDALSDFAGDRWDRVVDAILGQRRVGPAKVR